MNGNSLISTHTHTHTHTHYDLGASNPFVGGRTISDAEYLLPALSKHAWGDCTVVVADADVRAVCRAGGAGRATPGSFFCLSNCAWSFMKALRHRDRIILASFICVEVLKCASLFKRCVLFMYVSKFPATNPARVAKVIIMAVRIAENSGQQSPETVEGVSSSLGVSSCYQAIPCHAGSLETGGFLPASYAAVWDF